MPPWAPFERLTVTTASGTRVEPLPAGKELRELVLDSMQSTLLDIADAIEQRRAPAAGGRQALHILETTLAAYTSAALGGTVPVPLGPDSPVFRSGGQSSAPHMRVFELVEDADRREQFADRLHSRGLRMGAMNCSAWLHPRHGDEHGEIMKAAIRLASQLDVTKIVTMTGCPGDGSQAHTINWVFYPWPPEGVALQERQWEQAIPFWKELAAFASDHGIDRIALELHPMHLAYNVPTLLRLRDAIGPIIGANVDPSHMFWQHMDPPASVRALGDAVHHVHLKDVESNPTALGLAGVLDNRSFADPAQRAWNFRTVGQGHGQEFWESFFTALQEVGYDDVLSIENEDPIQPAEEGVAEAARFTQALRPQLPLPFEGADQ
jgi:sugar phosphate isomerase/epimerase